MSATYLITAPTFHRKRVFQNQRFGEVLTQILMRCREQQHFLLHDYVIMPDHAHLLLTTSADAEPGSIVKRFQQAVVDELFRDFGYSGEIWGAALSERRIDSPERYAEAARQIHSNPVRGGFCDREGEYRMSSRASRWVLDPLPESLRPTLQSA
jgi:putative transposase